MIFNKLNFIFFLLITVIASTINVNAASFPTLMKSSKCIKKTDLQSITVSLCANYETISSKKSISSATKQQLLASLKQFTLTTIAKRSELSEQTATAQNWLFSIAFVLPALTIGLHQKKINSKLWITICLTFLFWIPAVIYSLFVITKK